MADGHVCQLPRDLTEDPNRSAFLEGRAFSPSLLLLNAEPVDKTIYQILLWFLGTSDSAHPHDYLLPFISVGNGRCVVHTGIFQHPHIPPYILNIHTFCQETWDLKTCLLGLVNVFLTNGCGVRVGFLGRGGRDASWATLAFLPNRSCGTLLCHNNKICIQFNSSSALKQLRTNLPSFPI